MLKNIIVSLQVDGVHSWPTCDVLEVPFLKDTHRHIFHIQCKKLVSHNDRDIEIIQLKHTILDFLRDKFYSSTYRTHEFNNMSCEDIAELLLTEFNLSYCSVLEDNENGAEIYLRGNNNE